MIKKSIVLFIGFVVLALGFTNCGQAFAPLSGIDGVASISSSPSLVLDPSLRGQPNVLPVKVGCGYVNEPCVSVTICTPGTSTCQTIDNILLDTGSYGLRLFSSTVSLSLASITDTSGKNFAECVSYADGSSQWGPLKTADVVLGQEKASSVPIHIIDKTFGTAPASCTKLDTSPATTGFNGILGVGLFVADCGSGCATQAANNIYFTCSGSACTGSVIPIVKQVSNPVAFLANDNNGVILQTESIPDSGAVTANGYLILGINTRSNNTLALPSVLNANNVGEFTTTLKGSSYSSSFIDSGSNGLFFPLISSVSACSSSGEFSGFYCPTSEVKLTGIQQGADGAKSVWVGFVIGDASHDLANGNPNYAFDNLGGTTATGFDWGMPFFYGRSVAVGIEGRASSLGTGPLWAC